MLEGLTISVTTALPARIRRHEKRHINQYKSVDEYLKQANLQFAWENPCGGKYGRNPELRYNRQIKNKVMREFRNKLNTTYKNVNNTFRTANLPPHTADWSTKISDFDDLPHLNKTARPKVQMKKWYADLEVFTFIIGEMSRKEDNYRIKHPHDSSTYSLALRKLFKSSRAMLCDLQHTINDTIKHENKRPFPTKTTLETMEKRLPRLIKDIEGRERLHAFHIEYIFKSNINYLRRMKRGVVAWLKKNKRLNKSLNSSNSSTSSMNLSDVSISQSANSAESSSSRGWSSTESNYSENSSMMLRRRTRKHQKQ